MTQKPPQMKKTLDWRFLGRLPLVTSNAGDSGARGDQRIARAVIDHVWSSVGDGPVEEPIRGGRHGEALRSGL